MPNKEVTDNCIQDTTCFYKKIIFTNSKTVLLIEEITDKYRRLLQIRIHFLRRHVLCSSTILAKKNLKSKLTCYCCFFFFNLLWNCYCSSLLSVCLTKRRKLKFNWHLSSLIWRLILREKKTLGKQMHQCLSLTKI